MRTQQIQIYKFNELGKEEKETAIENERTNEFYLDYEWYDYLHKDFIEELNKIGVNCKGFFWDLYSSRDFKADELEVVDTQKFLKRIGLNKWLVMNGLRKEKTLIYHISLSEYGEAEVEIDFENEDNISNKEHEERAKERDEIENNIKPFIESKFSEFYSKLYKDYDYLLSDEAIRENLENNDCEFNKDGSRY